MSNAGRDIKFGNQYPYDAPDSWRSNDIDQKAPPPVDWAHSAARGILSNLNDRRGIKQELRQIDESTRKEIVESVAEIIREAEKTK
jgi:hypothetical protein